MRCRAEHGGEAFLEQKGGYMDRRVYSQPLCGFSPPGCAGFCWPYPKSNFLSFTLAIVGAKKESE